MFLYHLDRENTFPSDKTKQLLFPIRTNNTADAENFFFSAYPNGISHHGIRYLNTFDVKLSGYEATKLTYENSRIYTIEYVFEMVRLLHFPHLPSRFTSLFACQNREDIKYWYDILRKNSIDTSNATVKVIDTTNKFFICDSFWRDNSLNLETSTGNLPVFSPFAYHEWAKNYWKGIYSDFPSLEVLCELPVTVIDTVPYSDF